MIDISKITKKVKSFFEQEDVPSIVQDGERYHVFGKYMLNKKDQSVELYKDGHYVGTVSSSAIAMSWCMFDVKHDWKNSYSLLKNDEKFNRYKFQIENRKQILKNVKDYNDREWLLIRINEDIERMREVKRNLDKTIKLTKYIKIKGFNDNEPK